MKKQIILAAATIGMAACIMGCGKSEVNLMDFVEIEYEGVDGKGTAVVSINKDDLEDAIKDTKAGEELSKKRREKLVSSIEYEVDKTSGLSNGDKIEVSLEWDEDKAEKYGLTFTGEEQEFTVKDLKKLKKADAFKDITLEYSGVSPNLTVKIVNNSELAFLKDAYYSVDSNRGIAVGDKITVKVQYSESVAENAGYTVEAEEKEFTVEKADAYITSYDKIGDTALEKMKTQATDIINAKFADVYEYRSMMYKYMNNYYPYDFDLSTVNKTELKLSKAYFFKSKDMSETYYSQPANGLYLIYETTITDSVTTEATTIYIPVYFTNIIERESGDIDVVVTDGKIVSGGGSVWDNVYRDIVTTNKDTYDFEEKTF